MGRDYLDLCGPATLLVKASGHGEIAFGAMQASLDIDYGPDEIGFTWAGFDEMDQVSGSGSAELQDDGSLEIAFEYHLGDEAILKAVRQPSSTACYVHPFGSLVEPWNARKSWDVHRAPSLRTWAY